MATSTSFATALSSTDMIPDTATVQPYDILFNIISLQILGIIGVLANVFILVVVKKNKSLQTSCFLLICGESACAILFSGGFMIISGHEIATLTGAMGIVQSRVLCHLSMGFICLIGVQSCVIMTSCVAMDRLISILAPTLYRNKGHRYIKVCWAFCFTYATVSNVAGVFVGPPDLHDMVNCTNTFSGVSRPYMAYHGVFSLIFSVLCVLLYSAMFIAFNWRKKTILDVSAAQAFLKQQQACLPTVRLLMIIYGITSVIPEILVSTVASSEYTAVYTPRLAYYFGPVKASSALAQIIGLYFGSRQFKKYAKIMFGMNTETAVVAPMTSGANQRIGARMYRTGPPVL